MDKNEIGRRALFAVPIAAWIPMEKEGFRLGGKEFTEAELDKLIEYAVERLRPLLKNSLKGTRMQAGDTVRITYDATIT